MKRSNFIYAGVLSVMIIGYIAFSAACEPVCTKGSGVKGIETRNLPDFTKLEVGGAFEVVLTQESSNSIRIEADDNLLALILTDIKSDVLKISTEKALCPKTNMKLFISAKSLQALKAHGAVDLKTNNTISAEKFELTMSGASDVVISLETKLLISKLSGASELSLKGKADTHAVELSGAGEINASDFVVDKYALKLSGASECNINVQKELSVEASGASEVNYKGNPGILNKELSGAAELKAMR